MYNTRIAAISTILKPEFDAEIARIRELVGQKLFAPALVASQALHEQALENRDVAYLMAVCLRQLGRIPQALAVLSELEAQRPKYSGLFQERGHCHVASRAPQAAAEAFEIAVNLNPSRVASWQSLQVLYRMMGRPDDAERAALRVRTLASLPREVLAAFVLYADGELSAADQLVRDYLQTHGNHVEAMRLLAQISVQLDATAEAERLLAKVLELAPDYDVARYEYAMTMLARHQHMQSRAELDVLLKKDPGNRIYRYAYATVLMGIGDCGRALQLFRELLVETPNEPDLNLAAAYACKTLGLTAQAIERCRAAIAIRADHGEAFWNLANLKTYRFTDAELAQMRAALAAIEVAQVDRYHLFFALGKALEDRCEFAESFDYYERGNALKKTESGYRPEGLERSAAHQASLCTREFFATRHGFGCMDASPIFIVGLPRAGSTLIEQILASHSKVEATMELANIPRLVELLQGDSRTNSVSRYPAVLAELTAHECRRFGEQYLADTLIYRGGNAGRVPFFIDKMPNNFRHLGLIHLILPNAKIIDARRAPLACCFSNFKQLFASGQHFTYGMDDIARYYRMYVELMRHWDYALPGAILRVRHEDVVGDLESNVRRILEFCSLEFESQCVTFYETKRSVHSASSEQVRRPIYRDGVEQWRYYEPWLGPLKDALGPLI